MNQDIVRQVTERLGQVSDLLYQEKIEGAYRVLGSVVGSLEQVISMIEEETLQQELGEKLAEALQAMEDQDHILLADILQYEINERLLEWIDE